MVEELNVSVEVVDPPAVRVTLAGFSEAVRLPEDEAAVRVMVPLNPPRLARLMVEEPLEPVAKLTVVGLGEMLKSGTLTVMVTLWTRLPIVPVTVTV